MPIFMMFGKYSAESLKKVSAERTKKAVRIISANGGRSSPCKPCWGSTSSS